jgi:hypothetical protein
LVPEKKAGVCYKHRFSPPDAPSICYALRGKASNARSERKLLPNKDMNSLLYSNLLALTSVLQKEHRKGPS